MKETYGFNFSLDTLKTCVCAQCWGKLSSRLINRDNLNLYCAKCGDGHGFVTLAYAQRRQAESGSELVDVKHNLNLLGTTKTEEELIKELGF